jgi:hypothetical protein
MDALVIRDTHRLITLLQEYGFTAKQAEGFAEALRVLDVRDVATKTDLHELKVDLIKWIVGTHLAYAAIIVAVIVALL